MTDDERLAGEHDPMRCPLCLRDDLATQVQVDRHAAALRVVDRKLLEFWAQEAEAET